MKPQSQLLAVTRADDSVAIVEFVVKDFRPDGSVNFQRLATKEEVEKDLGKLQDSWALSDPQWVPIKKWRFIDQRPPREYRDALRDNGHGFTYDMDAARKRHRDELRFARAPILQLMDAEYAKAQDAGDKQRLKEIAAMRQALRDVTRHPDIDKAQTPEELKSAGWSVLNGA